MPSKLKYSTLSYYGVKEDGSRMYLAQALRETDRVVLYMRNKQY